jgi:hypothetical protein
MAAESPSVEKKAKLDAPSTVSMVPPAKRGTSIDGKYDYDLIVIGGGSGGLAASKVRHYIPDLIAFVCI